jgi:hypothetical protein
MRNYLKGDQLSLILSEFLDPDLLRFESLIVSISIDQVKKTMKFRG